MCLISATVHSNGLSDYDNSPFAGIFGLPDSSEGGFVLARGVHDWSSSVIVSSHNIGDVRSGETLRLDGETTRLAINHQFGISDKLSVGIEVPFLWHESGSLDNLIEGWHDVFGFPDGPRKGRATDLLEFFYSDSRGSFLRLNNNTNGIGDIRLLAGWRLASTEGRDTALRLSVKLPTGDSDTLLGSGGADVSIGIATDVTELWGNAKLSGMYRANLTFLSEPEFLSTRYNQYVGQFSFGLGYVAHPSVNLKVQSRIRSALYDSDTKNLGDVSVSTTFGADFRLSNRYQLVLSVGEDLKSGTGPDVSFQIALHYSGR